MPVRNIQILVITFVVCLACYLEARRLKYAGRIAKAMRVVENYYVEPVKGNDLFLGAMDGIIDKLDSYSEFIPPREYQQFQSYIEQQFGGVGILIEGPPTTERLTVIAPLPGTPAYEAGLQPGDVILSIDEKSTVGLKADDATQLMRGVVGTSVKLSIRRDGQSHPHEVELTRADIQVDSVFGDRIQADSTWNFLLEEDPRIAYIRINVFGERTVEEFQKATRNIKASAQALVIDLRFNPGGIVSAAVEICDMLLESGRIVSTRGRDTHFNSQHDARPGVDLPVSLPVVVMINEQSASSSEIVAACLQDSGRAKIAGDRSFGKGTVQQVFELDGQAAIKFTTARYYRPSGANIHRTESLRIEDAWGVLPDKELELKLNERQQVNLYRRWQFRGDPRKVAASERPPSPECSGDPQLRLVLASIRKQLGNQ